eukprot:CAMPEP_0115588254 /NCGR_PEP_ID=MMETSP0272-20121206/8620_1 /TAXON_ID=71861 /ORGANISM="Scrippsiella trochoidea, Strain CCMP3099" /LENGTH=188 /DNA_ID=CAMNT_0003023345 /DNA_START=504 /DNA_END=1070 /DNA_ORIENTATION=-
MAQDPMQGLLCCFMPGAVCCVDHEDDGVRPALQKLLPQREAVLLMLGRLASRIDEVQLVSLPSSVVVQHVVLGPRLPRWPALPSAVREHVAERCLPRIVQPKHQHPRRGLPWPAPLQHCVRRLGCKGGAVQQELRTPLQAEQAAACPFASHGRCALPQSKGQRGRRSSDNGPIEKHNPDEHCSTLHCR